MTAFAQDRPSPTATAQINITPLVDVLLVLLVIFMLAVPLPTRRLAMHNALPCARDCPQPATPVALSVKQTGELYWNGISISRATLAANLAALARDTDAPALIVHPEAHTRYALVTDVLAAANDAKLSRISLETAAR